MAWTPTTSDVAQLIVLSGEKVNAKRTTHYTELAPVLYDLACSWCNRNFDMESTDNRQEQSAVKLFIAKAAQFYETKTGLLGRSMGTVAYSYAGDIPDTVYKPLKPFRKLRW